MIVSLMDEKEQVVWACRQLEAQRLVRWTSGNASVVDRSTELVYIKPSGVRPYELQKNEISIVHLKNGWMSGGKPSTDTDTHLELYRRFNMGAIVHTHSNYATAWAATKQDIPCILTAMADEFGGPIRCARYAEIGSKDIAEAIAEVFKKWGAQVAVLIANHGVFTFGNTLNEAVKTAVMVEDCAKTASIASLGRLPSELSKDQITRNHERYLTSYGQKQYKQQPS